MRHKKTIGSCSHIPGTTIGFAQFYSDGTNSDDELLITQTGENDELLKFLEDNKCTLILHEFEKLIFINHRNEYKQKLVILDVEKYWLMKQYKEIILDAIGKL